ncbi:hypothetical protein ACFE04_002301 [Oxalis oulophora]
MSAPRFCGLKPLFFARRPGKNEAPRSKPISVPKRKKSSKASTKTSSPKWSGNFILMIELRKKIFIFRDLLDLTPCDGSASVTELMLQTTRDLHKLYPEIIPRVRISQMKQASPDQALARFNNSLRCLGDSCLPNDELMDKGSNPDKLVEIVLTRLKGLIKITKEKLDMMDEEDENTKSEISLENSYSPKSSRSYPESVSSENSSSSFCSSPITPKSVLPDYPKGSSGSPRLSTLRVQALGKLNPIDLKRLVSFHTLPQVVVQDVRVQDDETEKPIGNVAKEGLWECELNLDDKIVITDSNLEKILEETEDVELVQSPPIPSKDAPVIPTPPPPPPPAPRQISIKLCFKVVSPTPPPPPPFPTWKPYNVVSLPSQPNAKVPPPPPPPPPMLHKKVKSPPPPPPPPPPSFSSPKVVAPRPPPPPAPVSETSVIKPSPSVTLIPPPPPPSGSQSVSAPPPPPPMMSSNGGSTATPPPPPMSLGKGAPPPPPPRGGSGMTLRPKKNSKLKRSSQLGMLYRTLRGKIEGLKVAGNSSGAKKGTSRASAGSGQGMADALAEMTKRSGYFQQIEEDFQKYSKSVAELQREINSFQAKEKDELVKFHKHMESILEKLTDETQILARFEGFPQKKLETIRMAAALNSKLDSIFFELQNWKVEAPLGQLLDKTERYFNKIRVELDALERTKDEESKKFQSHNIHFDFGILVRIKEAMVDVSSNCMELALKERRDANSADITETNGVKSEARKKGCFKMLWKAFQFAFKVYTFAGGHDDRADMLTKALAQEIEKDPQA